MGKFLAILIPILGLSFKAQAILGPCPVDGCVAMPEPSAVPELILLLCVVFGYVAWRQHKAGRAKGQNS